MLSGRKAAGLLPILLMLAVSSAEAGFAFRKLITVTGSQVVGGPHADFPLGVMASDPQLRLSPLGGIRSAQACDVEFRASDGVTPLAHEIRSYDGASGTLAAFVRMPSVQNGVSTQLYIYYGDPSITCRPTRRGEVWDAGFRAVLHFAETSGNPLDSTSNGVAGRLNPQGDLGLVLNQNGETLQLVNPPIPPPGTFIPTTDSYLQLADGTLPANNAVTIEAWFRFAASNVGQHVGLVTKERDGGGGAGADWIGLYKSNAERLMLGMDAVGGPGNLSGATALAAGQWYYGAVSYGPSGRRVYLYDGLDAQNAVAGNYVALTLPTRVGDDSNGNYLSGLIGEVRFSTVERSAGWLQSTARNLGCPTAGLPAPTCVAPYPVSMRTPFVTLGAQQAVAPAPSSSDCCRVAASDDGTRVTAATSALAMIFDRSDGGGLTELRNDDEPNRTVSRHAETAKYTIFSTQVNDSTDTWHFERDAAGQIEVLEATPTRLRLRQLYDYMPSVHLQRVWSVGAMPRLAIDERLVIDSTQDLRGAQGLHPRGATSAGASICPSQLIPSGFGTYFYCNGQENPADRFFLVTDDHETYSDMLAVAHGTPFFGPTRAGTGGNYQHAWEDVTAGPETFYSRVHEPTRISTNAGTYRNLYVFYPQIAGLTSGGTEWQPYANDYRTPDVLSFNFWGTGWFDAGDLTVSPNDFYNEAEGAYQVDMNPATGLSVNIDGDTTARHRPLFKIRQWRSFVDPAVTLEGTALVSGRDFTADVMPFARAFHCTGPTEFAGCTTLANGGLAGASEYMNDSSAPRNYTLAFPDASTWFYLGADAKFRGINVRLATLGIGTADLQWEYWNGATWLNLEGTSGWNDGTSNLKAQGTISWGDDALELDPIGWTRLSIGSGPPLYYVRARIASGSYATPPVEAVMRTDVLLFQYCGDVTIADATFAFSVPPTTAVTLQSFDAFAGDGRVRLEWRTASELANLGFHLFRGGTADGPWTRLNAALIPGLGSSATGKSYALEDAGLTNGVRYFYRLEDVDASSRVTSHGPVSAVPLAAAGRNPPGGRREAGGHGASAESCPAWVRAAYGASAGGGEALDRMRCSRYGDPEATALEVVSRDSGSVTLELRTPGFYALHAPPGDPSGEVRVFVPGFDLPEGGAAAALPFRRALVDAVVGRRARLARVTASELQSFDLRPAALGRPEMQLGRDGTVRAVRRVAPAPRSVARGVLARLLPSVFLGEAKSAVVEIAPLGYDSRSHRLTLARRVVVRLEFRGREPGEHGRGRLGRAPGRKPRAASGEVLALLHTAARGLHAVSFEQLFPGRSRGLAASGLALERQGEAVAFHIEPQQDVFGPGSRLYFFADRAAASTDFSGEVAYELVRERDGRRMAVVSGSPSGEPVGDPSTGTAPFEIDRYYLPGLLDAASPWLWESLPSGVTRTVGFTLSGVEPNAAGEALLDVFLQGASESGLTIDHHVRLSVNGTPVGETAFAGKKPYLASLPVPASLLRDGANELALESVADTGTASLAFLDRVSLAYPQRPALVAGTFEGAWAAAGAARLSGATRPVAVADVTAEPRWLAGVEAAGPGAIRFRAEAGRTYLAAEAAAVGAPRVERPAASTLLRASNQADYLLVAPRAFLAATEPLVERRRGQGLAARAVAFEEIAEAFGHGQPSAEAVRSFLAFAFHSWTRPSPRYVLLVGDASYDPRHFTAGSGPAPLPALWARTAYLWTVSDPRLAAVNGDDALPDLAIGRLPAATAGEARLMVEKLVAWEDSGQGLAGPATLVADNPDAAGDFEANAEDIAESFLPGRSELLRLRELGGETRAGIRAALDDGRSYLSYVGHGGSASWASENVWSSWDAASLQAQSRQPLLVTLDCLNGYFVAPAFDSLAESLVKAEGRGAIAAFSPSGLSLDLPAHELHRALMAELTGGRHARLGDAILAAQAAYARSGLMPELLSVYHLLGDPALVIR